MGVGHGGLRNPRPMLKQIQRGGNELAKFVPVVRQAEPGRMRQGDGESEQRPKEEIDDWPDAAALSPRLDHCTVSPASCCAPVSWISPNADSYCVMFC